MQRIYAEARRHHRDRRQHQNRQRKDQNDEHRHLNFMGLHLLATHGRIPKAIASTYEKPACAISRCMVGAPPLNSRDESEQKALQFAFRLYAEQMRATGGKTPKGALPGTRKVDLVPRFNQFERI